ncbi:hypothetical protein CR513_25518, partial [Mucuna pruriens]
MAWFLRSRSYDFGPNVPRKLGQMAGVEVGITSFVIHKQKQRIQWTFLLWYKIYSPLKREVICRKTSSVQGILDDHIQILPLLYSASLEIKVGSTFEDAWLPPVNEARLIAVCITAVFSRKSCNNCPSIFHHTKSQKRMTSIALVVAPETTNKPCDDAD